MGLFGKPDAKPASASSPSAATPSAAPAPAPASRPAGRGTVMGDKTRFNGKLETDESLVIHGRVEGEIKSTSEVEIGESGDVKGTISAKTLVIAGRVTGDCTAADRLEIRASGKLNGGIKAARISIADGAEFKGTSQMTPAGKA